MTCIIGLVENGKVYLGADSAAVSGYDLRTSPIKKVFKRNFRCVDFYFAYTSSFRMGQLLEYQLLLDEIPHKKDFGYVVDMDYMVNHFVENVRDLFKQKGYSRVKENEEWGGNFIVGVQKRLFHIESDFQVHEYLDYTADGSGKQYAHAALEALRTVIPDPYQRIVEAIKISAKFTTSVALPAVVIGPDNLIVSDTVSR